MKVKIVDFGLAKLAGQTKLTKSGTSLGTVAYMSPEQAQGAIVDHRTDIWALGAVLYEMVTGQQPFKGDYEQAVVYSILHEDPEPIKTLRTDLPMELAIIANKCLAKEPPERYQHVDEMLVPLTALNETLKAAKLKSKPPKETSPKKKRTFLYAGIATALLLLLAARFFFTDSGGTKVIDSIAVLPLDNLSGNPKQEYFADGMTEALIADLSRISSLRVISRRSVMQYKGVHKPLTEIARELNVAAIVVGSVFQDGERVRITVQLIEAARDRHLWAKEYDRDLRDILALQSEVARAIAREINITLTQDEETRLASSHAVNPAAHEVFLQGQYHLRRGQNSAENRADEIKSSIAFFQQAIELDPDWALAHAVLAQAYHWFGSKGGLSSPAGFYSKSKATARKALELDETVSQAHAALGFVLYRYDWDWVGAERELRRAVELDPNSHAWEVALFLYFVGSYEEAILWYKRAEERNPLSVPLKAELGSAYTCAGHYDQAIEYLRNTLDLKPSDRALQYFLVNAYLRKSMYEEAIAEVQKVLALGESAGFLALLGRAYTLAGRRDDALEVLNQLQKRYGNGFSLDLVQIYIALGNKDKALTLLQKAYEKRHGWLPSIKCSIMSDSLRDNPAFQEILRGINFPEGDIQFETRK
ncbi:MAG: tetratricopeptide repeat protein [Ignavibacteria bacterium]|nr:tetratricopeptide repeat protein [Ignavibacteria bacterium]